MELAGTIWNVAKCLWGCTKQHADYISDLQENIQLLKSKWEDLQSISQDVKTRADGAEKTGEMRRSNEVNTWLRKVNAIEGEIEDIQVQATQEIHNKCLSNCCPKNCSSSYKLGVKVVKMLKRVDELTTLGNKFGKDVDVANNVPRKLVNVMPIDETVGLDLMVEKVWNSIEAKNVGVIGLYGMGGAGKTTLMKRINNEFAKRGLDSLVLWVVVSKDRDIDRIMDSIRKRLEITEAFWKDRSKDERAAMIYEVLKERKFVLLLDDIWERLDLTMGIPLPEETNYQSKVLFTTRSHDVCAKMLAHKTFKVECLTEEEAFDLFCRKVGQQTLNSHQAIAKVAWDIAQECKGLPLALITVGSAMAGVKSVQAWKEARNDLMSSAWTASDLEKNVFSILKFSYDKLPDDTHRKCFLYCALYPEDYEIPVVLLTNRWMGEGLLAKDKIESIYDTYDRGVSIIERLKLSCLLEGIKDDESLSNTVKMHDVIRDMALWLACDQDQNKNKVLVQQEALAVPQNNADKWEVVERISIVNCNEENWRIQPCPNLLTLVLSGVCRITGFSNIKSMSRLKVLDLSHNDLNYLPAEIGQLIHLEYLNLSESSIDSILPIELKNLKKLRIFLMQSVSKCNLEIIPLEVISSLEMLQVFRFSVRLIKPADDLKKFSELERSFLENLEFLSNLGELSLQIQTDNGLKKLLESTKLKSCTRGFRLVAIKTPVDMPSLLASMSTMTHLEAMRLEELHFNSSLIDTCHLSQLRWVEIMYCDSITHLTWLKHAPLLEFLKIVKCSSIEEVIKAGPEDDRDKGNVDNLFSYLVNLHLAWLPNLKSIHERALRLPSLKLIHISDCPNLKKLPFHSASVKNSLREIRGDQDWCDNLEWEDTATEDIFRSKVRPYTSDEPRHGCFREDCLRTQWLKG